MGNNDHMMVLGYVRVSTENQLENYSIEEQTERLNSYCKAKGWTLLKTYTDGGYSGGNTERPALQTMLKDIKASKVDAVVVYKLDRLSRNQKDTLTLIEDEFLKNGVDFVSINENFDTSTPFGRAMIGILSVFAQLEKDQITERFRMGKVGRSKAGYFHGGPNYPFGYSYENGELIIDEYAAMQVREIYKRFLAGKSINSIYLEIQGEYGGKWSADKARTILLNNVYTGKIKYLGEVYDGKHTPIITEEVYNQVQGLIFSQAREESKSSAQKTPFRASALLSSLIICGRCGARYFVKKNKYRCYSRSKGNLKFVIDPACKNDFWPIETLNERVISEIKRLADDKQLLQSMLKTKADEEPSVDYDTIRKRIRDIEKQTGRLIELFQVGSIPMETITQRIDGLNVEKKHLEDMLNSDMSPCPHKGELFLDNLTNFINNFDDAPLDAQRLLIRSLVQSVRIDGDQVMINWRL